MVLAGELHMAAYLPVAVLVHLALARITRHDPYTRQVYVRYNLQADTYDPWIQPRVRSRRGLSGGRCNPLC